MSLFSEHYFPLTDDIIRAALKQSPFSLHYLFKNVSLNKVLSRIHRIQHHCLPSGPKLNTYFASYQKFSIPLIYNAFISRDWIRLSSIWPSIIHALLLYLNPFECDHKETPHNSRDSFKTDSCRSFLQNSSFSMHNIRFYFCSKRKTILCYPRTLLLWIISTLFLCKSYYI